MALVKSLRTGIKFKETPIGKIPVDWEARAIADVCDVIGGSTPSTAIKDYWNGHILWATPTDITNLKGRIIEDTKQKISEKGLASSAANLLPEGSILMTSRATIGACAINARPMATNQGFASLVCKDRAYNWFIFYLVSFFRKGLERLGSGSTFKEISKKSIRSFHIPLPPLNEQKKIAEFLVTVDDAIEETDKIIEKTKELKKGLMQKLLTRGIGHKKFKKTEIGKIPADWELKSLADFISVKHGYAFEGQHFGNEGPILLTPGNFAEHGGVYFNHRNVKKYSGEYPEEFVLSPGDLVLVMTDLSPFCKILGNPAIIPDGNTLLHNQRIGKVVFKNKKMIKEFLLYFFLSRRFKQMIKSTATGTTVRHTAPNRIVNIKIALPQIVEQKKIAAALSEVDSEIKRQEAYKAHLEETKKSLMQVLLTGKVRVQLRQ